MKEDNDAENVIHSIQREISERDSLLDEFESVYSETVELFERLNFGIEATTQGFSDPERDEDFDEDSQLDEEDEHFVAFGWGKVARKWQLFELRGQYGFPETFQKRPLKDTSIKTRSAFLIVFPELLEELRKEMRERNSHLRSVLKRVRRNLDPKK